jgi:hypothetical protein
MKYGIIVSITTLGLFTTGHLAQATAVQDTACDPFVRVYLNQMQHHVVNYWQPDLIPTPYLVTFKLQVNRQGHLVGHPVTTVSSGLAKADNQALAAVKAAVPFQPLPVCHTLPVLDMTLTLTYTPNTVRRISALK